MTSPSDDQASTSAGIRAGIIAYLIWGFLTIYWKELSEFRPAELIGWRILTAAAVMALVVTVRRSWPAIGAALRDRRILVRILIAALLLTANWGAYVYAIVEGHVIETALGYFIAPLGTMMIGIFVFREHPTRAQKVAMALVAAAVIELSVSYGAVPWAAIIIAASWSIYGLLKRQVPLAAIDSFAAESFVLVVPAAVFVIAMAGSAMSIPRSASAGELTLVLFSGVATAIPLTMFAYAAPRVPFTILGPMQFVVPIINFLLGWLIYDEALPFSRVVGFGLVWIALVMVTVDRVRVSRAPAPLPLEQPAPVGSA